MRELIDERAWLTAFRFPVHTPDLNPAEGIWAHSRTSLGSLVPCLVDVGQGGEDLPVGGVAPDVGPRPARRRVRTAGA